MTHALSGRPTVHPLTMPGVGASAAESSEIGIADWVAAVVDEIDRATGLVVLVGHSGGGNVVYGAADARPERMARMVFVDTFPPGEGGSIWEFPKVDGVVPFPGWDSFEEAEVADLDAATRASVERGRDPCRAGADRCPSALRRAPPRVPATMLTGTVSRRRSVGSSARLPIGRRSSPPSRISRSSS